MSIWSTVRLSQKNIIGVNIVLKSIIDVLKAKPKTAWAVTEKFYDVFNVTSYKRIDDGYVSDKTYCFRDIGFKNDNRGHVFNLMTNFKYAEDFVPNPYEIICNYAFSSTIGIKWVEEQKLKPIDTDTPILKDVCIEMREFSDRIVSCTTLDNIIKTQRWR